MATRRYSLNVEDNDHTPLEAVGAATVFRSIELTVDWDGLTAQGLSGQQARMKVLDALTNLANYIETSGKYNVAA